MLGELFLPILARAAADVAGDYLQHYAMLNPVTGTTVFMPATPSAGAQAQTLNLMWALASRPQLNRMVKRSSWTTLLTGTATRTALRLATGDTVAVVIAGWQEDLARQLADRIEAAASRPSPYFST